MDPADAAHADDRDPAVAELLLLFWRQDALVPAERLLIVPGSLWRRHGRRVGGSEGCVHDHWSLFGHVLDSWLLGLPVDRLGRCIVLGRLGVGFRGDCHGSIGILLTFAGIQVGVAWGN